MQDSDDDGESAAGACLLNLLRLTAATNVCIVVSRWYGGVHLGPARFTLFKKAARQTLEEAGLLPEQGGKDKKKGGK